MNVEASLFHHSPWYVEQVYEEGPGKYSVFSVFSHEDRDKAPPFMLRGLSKGNVSRLPKRVNSAAAQIQTGFSQCRHKLVSFQLPLTTCLSMSSLPTSKILAAQPARTSAQYLSMMFQAQWHKKWSKKQQFPPNHVTATVSTDKNWYFYLLFILAEGISKTQMPFFFLNILKFLQQKRPFRATYMQVMTQEFKVTLPHKPHWN